MLAAADAHQELRAAAIALICSKIKWKRWCLDMLRIKTCGKSTY